MGSAGKHLSKAVPVIYTGGAQIHNGYKTVLHNISRLGGMAR